LPAKSGRGLPQAKEMNHPDSESGDFTHKKTFQRKAAKSPSRKDGNDSLQCYLRKLCILRKVFHALFSLFAPVHVVWLRLAALRLSTLAPLR
jgi:hypothetical protein